MEPAVRDGLPMFERRGHEAAATARGVNQPCLTLLAATDRDLLSLLDAHLVRVTDSPPSRGYRARCWRTGLVKTSRTC